MAVSQDVRVTSLRKLPDGTTLHRISEAALPTLRVIPSPRIGRYGRVESIGWVLPMDDHHFRIYVAGRVRESGELVRMRSRLNGRLWEELSDAEHQAFPGDFEAQVSQGPIAWHSDEHLATSDRGVIMLRKLLRRQLDAIHDGQDPAGVIRDPAAPPVRFARRKLPPPALRPAARRMPTLCNNARCRLRLAATTRARYAGRLTMKPGSGGS